MEFVSLDGSHKSEDLTSDFESNMITYLQFFLLQRLD
jgi:hypothetical protein